MPHQCTGCGRTFADGSKEMLSGCPDCGGNKFQFQPKSQVDVTGSGTADAADPSGTGTPDPETADRGPDGAPTDAGATDDDGDVSISDLANSAVDAVSGGGSDDAGATPDPANDAEATSDPANDAEATPDSADDAELEPGTDDENAAQASARSDVVNRDELPEVDADGPGTAASPTADDPGADAGAEPTERPELSDLREELNDQFESIKIVSPGKYELNLMELYDRQEYIISLQEDGRYVIEMPDTWRDEER